MTTDASTKTTRSAGQRVSADRLVIQSPHEFYQKLIKRVDTRKILEQLARK